VLDCESDKIIFKYIKIECFGYEKLFHIVIKPSLIG
jgi:hypothetical protein